MGGMAGANTLCSDSLLLLILCLTYHVYYDHDQHFEYALLSLGLDARGVAVREDWQPDTAALRTWLRKLRGICTHPQVGQLLNQNDKINKPGVLKTIGEVLEVCSILPKETFEIITYEYLNRE